MALYKDGNPVSGLNSIPRLTLAQYNALNVKPEFWVRTDAPESYKKLSADQVSYDSNNTVKDKIDSLENGITVLATSSGSKTYAQHILALKPAWDSLNTEQRLKCKLVCGTLIFQCIDAGSVGRFACTLIDNQKIYAEMIRISNQTYGYVHDGETYTDMSNNTANIILKLYLPL